MTWAVTSAMTARLVAQVLHNAIPHKGNCPGWPRTAPGRYSVSPSMLQMNVFPRESCHASWAPGHPGGVVPLSTGRIPVALSPGKNFLPERVFWGALPPIVAFLPRLWGFSLHTTNLEAAGDT